LGNNNLTEINIPNSVTTINEYGFYCSYKLPYIQIPSSITTIGSCAFGNNFELDSFDVSEQNLVYKDIDGILFNKAGTIIYTVPIGNPRTTYTVPDGVTRIVSTGFFNCTRLTNVTIPSSVTTIGGNTFLDCDNLTQITINKSTNSITGAKWGAPATTVVSWNP
jgi:hypothetical protein